MNKPDEAALVAMLAARQIRPTAIRLLVLRAMAGVDYAVSLVDLEALLPTVDRSSLFRTVTHFLARHLVHAIDDGSGAAKYALCADTCQCAPSDLHVHFYCERCGRTFCIDNIPIPMVPLPARFVLHGANFVMKGLCDKCSRMFPNATT